MFEDALGHVDVFNERDPLHLATALTAYEDMNSNTRRSSAAQSSRRSRGNDGKATLDGARLSHAERHARRILAGGIPRTVDCTMLGCERHCFGPSTCFSV